MLEKIDMDKKIGKKELKEAKDRLFPKLSYLQRALRELEVPVIIVVEGLDTSGKGTLINNIIEPLDPRGFAVYTNGKESEDERMHPYMWRFFRNIPSKGRIAIFDGGWYGPVLRKWSDKKDPQPKKRTLDNIASFEKQLTDDGYCIIKLFTLISKKEQKKRQEKLLDKKSTRWLVSEDDIRRHKQYKDYLELNAKVMAKTQYSYAKWNVIESDDIDYATVKSLEIVAEEFEAAIALAKADKKKERDLTKDGHINSILSNTDLSKKLTKEEYKEELCILQKELKKLHSQIYQHRIPVVLAFEGWDAGGKGGAIKRLTQCLDPRGYVVNPVSAPVGEERTHHYLWRFWTKFPKAGHIAIFDRSWYGRVMVERIEGFCSESEWKRAYGEINDMERQLVEDGAVVLKFWLHISKDEQERRFKERQEDPAKQWKITDEDWRNRAKWDEYEKAVDEMITRTNMVPWTIVAGNDKYYARIYVLRNVVSALKKRVNELDEKD